MSAIPDEIMREARRVADEHDTRMQTIYRPGAPERHAVLVDLVARALRARDERAARIVREGHEVRDPLDNFQSTIMDDWNDMDALAAAILSDAEQSHAE